MGSSGNQGFGAAVLEDPTIQTDRTMQMLWMHNQRQQQTLALKQQRELARQKGLTDYLDKRIDNKNFATGDPTVDPLIEQQVSVLHRKYADMISKNPNLSESDLEGQMQDDLLGLTQYSAKIKASRAGITQQIASLKNNPGMSGLDLDGLEKGAIHRMLYQGGDDLITDPAKIDPNQNYVNDELTANSKHYVIGQEPLLNAIKADTPLETAVEPRITTEHGGITVEKGYNAKLHSWQSLSKDAKGNVTGIQTNGIPATLSDGSAVIDPDTKKPMLIADPDTIRKLWTPNMAAQLNRDANEWFTSHGQDPSKYAYESEVRQNVMKHLLYDQLDKNSQKDFSLINKQTESGLAQKMEMGWVDALGRTISKADERREAELLGTGNAKIRMAANLNPDILEAGTPYTDPTSGKQYIDVTDAVGGFKTLADRKATTLDPGYRQVSKILIDTKTPGTLYTEENAQGGKGHVVAYKGPEIDALLTRHATANGYKSLKDVNDINKNIPIAPNADPATVASINAKMKKKGEEATASANAARRQKITEQLGKLDNGNAEALNGIEVAGGKIAAVSVRGGIRTLMGQDKYSVDIKDKNGKVTTQTFPDRASLEKFVNGGSTAKPKTTDELGDEYGF